MIIIRKRISRYVLSGIAPLLSATYNGPKLTRSDPPRKSKDDIKPRMNRMQPR